MRSSKDILYCYAVRFAERCSDLTMISRTLNSRCCGLLLHEAAQRATVQKLHGVASKKYMKSYLQCTVQSLFSFGLDSAARLH